MNWEEKFREEVNPTSTYGDFYAEFSGWLENKLDELQNSKRYTEEDMCDAYMVGNRDGNNGFGLLDSELILEEIEYYKSGRKK